MLILHGSYDHGKIEINEKNLPQIKTDIEIILPEPSSDSDRFKNLAAFGMWENRNDINPDSTEWVRQNREQIQKRNR